MEHRHETAQLLAEPKGLVDRVRAYVILGVISEHEQDWQQDWQAALQSYIRALAARLSPEESV